MPEPAMLTVEDLHASVEGKEILRGIDLQVPQGEIHALMGPNGSGKSTLAYTLMGHPRYEVTSGRASFDGTDLLPLGADERARLGLFLSLQYPTAIPGVTVMNFLRAAMRAQGKETSAKEFIKRVKEEMAALNMDESFRQRYVNDGFSGGEKKRSEILQLALLRPRLAILDETDSGLDVDALRTVAEGVQRLSGRGAAIPTDSRRPAAGAAGSPDVGLLVITHYPRILEYLVPDVVHVLHQGRVVTSGGHDLAKRIEREGYDFILGAGATAAAEQTPAGVSG